MLEEKKLGLLPARLLAPLACALGLLASAEAHAQNWVERTATGAGSATFDDSVWLCGLSGVKGNFDDNDYDGGEQYVGVFHVGGEWQLQAGEGRTGRMVCTKWSNFTRRAGAVTWISDGFDLASYNREVSFSKSTNTWWGDAATMLGFMGGEFDGGGEYLQVTQSVDASAPSVFKLRSEAGDVLAPTDILGTAYSVFVGNPDDHLRVRLIGYNTAGTKVRGTSTTAGTFEMAVSSESGFSSFWLANTSGSLGGFCYFTRLSGDFNGNGESATITEVSSTWKLSVAAGGGKAYASARCMAYDQR